MWYLFGVRQSRPKAHPLIARTIRFQERLRAKINADAERCGRSFEGQVIALLRRHYGEDVDIAPPAGEILALAALWCFAPEDSDPGHAMSVDLAARILGPRAVADTDELKLDLSGWDGDDLIIAPHPDVLASANPSPVTDHHGSVQGAA